MIPQSYLDDLLSRVDLSDIISEYVPDLKRTGSGYSACCPFHTESTPSFTVTPQKGFFHCFGCGEHGNAINFLMKKTSCGFVDAVKQLSSQVGMEIPKQEQAEKNTDGKNSAMKFMRICATLKTAQEIYSLLLETHPYAMEYLEKRGLTQDTIQRYGIGYAPDAWDTISKNKSIRKEDAELAGLVTNKPGSSHKYDRFRDRIMFPIYGAKDYIIGFGGRLLGEQDQKYLNSPEGEYFKKGDNLYGLKQAQLSSKTGSRLFGVEGYMDVAMLAQYGLQNVVAFMGTALTETQIKKLMRASAHITFCMDGDEPGRNAAQKIAVALLPHMNDIQKLDFMFLPDGNDPDEFVRLNGLDAFLAEAEKAKSVIDFLVSNLKVRENTSTSDGMVRYLSAINEWVEQIHCGPTKLAFQKHAADMANISLDALLGISTKSIPNQPQPIWQQASPNALSISVAASMLGIAVVKDPRLAAQIDIGLIEPFMTLQDREMLFPLLLYVKTNPLASKDAIVISLSYNPHVRVIQDIVKAAQLLGDAFNAKAEAKIVIDGFRKMRRVQEIICAQ